MALHPPRGMHRLVGQLASTRRHSTRRLARRSLSKGSVTRPADIDLNVARIEAWSNGKQVGSITEDQFLISGTHSDFLLTIPTLPAGSHTLLLQAILRDGTISTTVFLPIAILPGPTYRCFL